ncbi:MAG TPA: fatty acid desaturase [Polyangiales bacterium]|nr:fatty acid desaturase [Polyangiales bacterium]
MPSATPTLPMSNLRAYVLHLWAFVLPLITLTYWLTGPHAWWSSILWTMPVWTLVWIDNHAPDDARQPREDIPSWPFDMQVYLLFALQVLNHVLLGWAASRLDLSTTAGKIDAAAAFIPIMVLTGVNAGYSGIVVAHELVHRRNPIEFLMGRILLMGVLYEHFATEHVRGHHPRIGTRKDPATARFGETHKDFMRRTVPAQFRSAWRLEKVRLGDPNMRWYDPRMVRHRVLQGVIAELAVLAAFFVFFGWLAAVMFFVQARSAVLMLETVNYIEHWGLTRQGKKVESIDSWDTANWFTLYTLVGLSRHADHHAQASRPYQKLRHFEETAKMPLGYYGTLLMALFRNERYMVLATAELKRKGLGPYRDPEAKISLRAHTHPSLRPMADEDGEQAAAPA